MSIKCTKCNNDNFDAGKFCTSCGASLLNQCSSCGQINKTISNFCGECGVGFQNSESQKDVDYQNEYDTDIPIIQKDDLEQLERLILMMAKTSVHPNSFYSHAVAANDFLDEHILIHDDVFKSAGSIKNLFKSIDYEGYSSKLFNLQKRLENLIEIIQKHSTDKEFMNKWHIKTNLEFTDTLLEFTDHLKISVITLNKICFNLHLKKRKSIEWTFSEHEQLIKFYEQNELKRQTIGFNLNTLL